MGLAITRAALDAVAREHFGTEPEWDLRHVNTLRRAVEADLPYADVVIGNPPFGRVRLSTEERTAFSRSVRGHANLYGPFVDAAFRISRGLVGYVMPTSWLAGDYFAALRGEVTRTRPLRSLRFLEARTGVFDDVLQEMCLAVFDAPHQPQGTTVFDGLLSERPRRVHAGGGGPWLIARCDQDAELIRAALSHGHRLSHYGYEVHTGPLVWNRHRSQLRQRAGRYGVPIIWSDAVRADEVVDPSVSNREQRFLAVDGMQHLLLDSPAVVVKRTTAKEQPRRLVAAPFVNPPAVVENHLNIVSAGPVEPKVPAEILSALLNSEPVDQLFRCISGSVAVSASELAALPLPAPDALEGLLEAEDRDAAVLAAYFSTRD